MQLYTFLFFPDAPVLFRGWKDSRGDVKRGRFLDIIRNDGRGHQCHCAAVVGMRLADEDATFSKPSSIEITEE
jgi:hypothetical protein